MIWGYYSGPLPLRELVEWVILFNTYYPWGVDGASDVMDLQNIATHELGHAVGMGDLYNACAQETMYGYSGYGETSKRTLGTVRRTC